jgi:hypothetical protein
MRILHLIDYRPPAESRHRRASGGDEAVLACAALAARTPEHSHSLCVIGGSWTESRAAACGFPTTDRVHVPFHEAARAARGLRSLIADRGRPDAAVCWSTATAGVAMRVLQAGTRIVAVPFNAPPPTSDGAPHDAFLIAAAEMSGGVEQVYVAAPLRSHRSWGEEVHIGDATPALAPPPHPWTRDALRASAGIDPGAVVVVLLSPGGCADAHRFVFVTSLCAAAGADVVALVPRQSLQRARALRLHRLYGRPRRLIVSDLALPELLAAADLAVCGDPFIGASAVAIAAAHRAGVPVLAPDTCAPPALYTPEAADACIAHSSTAAEIARRLVPLVLDVPARRVLGDGLASLEASDAPVFDLIRAAWSGAGRDVPAGVSPACAT